MVDRLKLELFEELAVVVETLRVCGEKLDSLSVEFFCDDSKVVLDLPRMRDRVLLARSFIKKYVDSSPK